MSKFDEIFGKARVFIYRNARPLDLARWRYHFEGGAHEDVLTALAAYQNADGGFGHALEADNFNPNSAPMQTWSACEILREINFTDGSHSIIKGILRYLDSGADFSEKHNQWLSTVKSNDDYPHAVWWNYSERDKDFGYNPTANLAGFILRFADKESRLYKKALEIAKQAYEWFISNAPIGDDHNAHCLMRLYEYLSETGLELVDMRTFAEKLKEEINNNICRETERWKTEYVCRPSMFINSKESMFFEDNRELIEKECELLTEAQLDDGSYIVPWLWYNDYTEYTLAANWWKSILLIKYMRFLREFG
ncbi:MAG: hypothetical protein K2N38_14585 [Oscillospiraceae bacterium]|nr:hypothetical protein [Oscillospiraceae bacterium]